MNGLYLFKLKQVPVFVSGWYLLLMVYAGFMVGDIATGLMWAGAITVSILVHEFGHAMVARHYGLTPQVLLHGFGGLCAHKPAERDLHSTWILIAGPGAGLVLGAIFFATDYLVTANNPGWLTQRPLMSSFLWMMIYINLFWSLVNLVPLWPLDGGQLFKLGLKQKLEPLKTDRVAHGIGAALAGAGLVYGLYVGWFFVAILCGFLGWANVSRFRAAGQTRPGEVRRKPNKFAESLYDSALDAMNRQHWEEAIRLGHQMRSESLTNDQLNAVWELLTVAHANAGKWEESLRYSKRAPDSAPVAEARQRALEALGREPEPDDTVFSNASAQ